MAFIPAPAYGDVFPAWASSPKRRCSNTLSHILVL